MASTLNAYQQPVGSPLPGWSARPRPARDAIEGRHCRLEPLDAARHAAQLHAAYVKASDGRDWTYMTVGPFADEASYRAHCEQAAASTDPLHYNGEVLALAHGQPREKLGIARTGAG